MVEFPAPKCKPNSATTETGSLVKGHLELAVRSMARIPGRGVDNVTHIIRNSWASRESSSR